jgi:hypothetical protein
VCASTLSPTFTFFESTDEFSSAFTAVPLGSVAAFAAASAELLGVVGVCALV